MRLIAQPLTNGVELCARLGLVLVSEPIFGGNVIHAVLAGSPSERAGLEPGDIVFTVNKVQWELIRYLIFSDRRPSELNFKLFLARYFKTANITVCVPPDLYRPIEDIVTEAMRAAAAQPPPHVFTYVNPRSFSIRWRDAHRLRRPRRHA